MPVDGVLSGKAALVTGAGRCIGPNIRPEGEPPVLEKKGWAA